MSELTSHSLTSLSQLIRTKQVSPVELLEAYHDRIQQVNPHLNAIVTLAGDALDKALQAEQAIFQGEHLGPLHGLPLTIKDTIETAGLRTTSGSLTRSDFVPEVDAAAVARLKAAGAIILGKSNTAEMAMEYTSDNPVFGRTFNPHDHSRSPGGSSGGEAAAIAAEISPGGFGSDLAGSVRIPAHFCGICGLRPTVGRIPGEGQFPSASGPYALASVIGPMARSVSDLKLLFSAFSSSSATVQNFAHARVAFYTNDSVSPVTAETKAAVETVAKLLSEMGIATEEKLPPGVERGYELWLKIFSRGSVVILRSVYAGREKDGGNFVRWRLATADDAPPPTLDAYIQSWMDRDSLRRQLINWMETYQFIIAPVGATPALPHDTVKVSVGQTTVGVFRAFSYSQTYNTFDLPSVVIPVSKSAEGLPIGVQIIGRPFQEEALLDFAEQIEARLTGGN